MGASATGATEALARFVTLGGTDLGPAHARAVASLVVDTVGVAVAGSTTSPVTGLTEWLESEGRLAEQSGGSVLWGTNRVVATSAAALVNGTAGHALDWDDASPSIPSHPATVILPAILAVAPHAGADGERLVRAYSIGSAVLRAVVEAMPDTEHYGRGFHTTSTVGRIAATAAVAVMHGLDLRETRTALGVATSLVAGSRANFGTDIKSIHAGLAARDGVTAVGLVRAGVSAHPDIVEHPSGLFALYGSNVPDALALVDRLEHWQDAWLEDYAIKVYPSCYGTHRPLDALLELRSQGLRPEDVADVRITVETGWTRALRPEPPTSGLEAKFSLPYTGAVALQEGAVTLEDFTDAGLARPEVQDMMARITYTEADVPPMGGPTDGSWAVARVETTTGEVHQTRIDATHGDARNPLTMDELQAKFASAVPHDADTARTWATRLAGVVDLPDLRDLNTLLAGPPPR